jgi:dTDP-4-dehydrorhamnose 3,5-epimerase
MKFTALEIPEVILIEPTIHGDDRGYFMETYRHDKLEEFTGFRINFRQDNQSLSSYGVLRGLHYQTDEHAQSKLVRVLHGEVLDVAVDIRQGSPTFGQHLSQVLSSENQKQLFIPKGFAHGFGVLREKAVFSYKVDNFYAPAADRGILFNDPTLNIDWSLDESKLLCSEKDLNQPTFEKAEMQDYAFPFYQPLMKVA